MAVEMGYQVEQALNLDLISLSTAKECYMNSMFLVIILNGDCVGTNFSYIGHESYDS